MKKLISALVVASLLLPSVRVEAKPSEEFLIGVAYQGVYQRVEKSDMPVADRLLLLDVLSETKDLPYRLVRQYCAYRSIGYDAEKSVQKLAHANFQALDQMQANQKARDVLTRALFFSVIFAIDNQCEGFSD